MPIKAEVRWFWRWDATGLAHPHDSWWSSTLRYSGVGALCFALLFVHPAEATVVATYDFEDGTVQGWSAFFTAATPINSTAEAFSGTHSLLDTTDSHGGLGPGISVSSLLLPGATYMITGELRLTAGETQISQCLDMIPFAPGVPASTRLGPFKFP